MIIMIYLAYNPLQLAFSPIYRLQPTPQGKGQEVFELGVSKNRGTPKMDGENNGKPY